MAMAEEEIWGHLNYYEETCVEIAKKLEDAARRLQFCNRSEEVVEVLVELFNEVAKLLRV